MLHKPTSNPTLPDPTSSPATPIPTVTPTTRSPTDKVYEYTIDSTKCPLAGRDDNNIQGPPPLDDKSDVALHFFAFGDTPYDDDCDTCNTCIENGQPVSECSLYTCTVDNTDLDSLPINNTCTFEGDEYACLKNYILPWMQAQTVAGEAEFSVHIGDIMKGQSGIGGNRRCQDSSFTSRKNLFSPLDNFLLTPGGMLVYDML